MSKNKTASGKEAGSVDWDAIRERLGVARKRLQQGWDTTPEKRKAVLKARAKRLAESRNEKEKGEEFIDVVTFTLAHERYGIESGFVREVHPLKEYTPLPGTSPFILGLVNVRGQILPLVDVKKLFDLPQKGLTDLNKVLILCWQQTELAVLADTVLGTQQIPVDEIQPSLPALEGIRRDCFRGVTRDRLVILDVSAIFSTPINRGPGRSQGENEA